MPQAKPLIQHSLRGIRRLLPENGHVAGRNSGFALTRVSVFPSRHQLRVKGWPVGISMTKLSPVHCRKSRQSARGRNAGCDQVRTENQEAEGVGAESGIYLPLSARASLLLQVARTGSYESTTSGYIASNTAQRYCQNDSTDEICTRSFGLCGFSICGPKLTICMPGYFSPITPHSRPACMITNFASSPVSFLFTSCSLRTISLPGSGFHPG